MRWLLLCLISVGYAQVLPYTDVNSTNTVTLSNKTITSAANTLTIDCNIATCTNFPAGAGGANPTGTVGLTAVNGSSGSFLRADGAPPLSQSISPTWTGTHTFNGTVAGTALSTYLASPPAIGGTSPAAGSFTTLTSSSGMALSSLATQATNTIVGNATSGSAVPTALSIGGCSTSASALIWTTNTGFGCNTSINAATLGGATFAAPGAIGGGTAAAGTFTALTGTSGTLAGLTGLAIRDTSAAFDVTLAATSSTNLSAGRTLTLDMKNVAHTLAFNATANTITFPNTSSYTLIGSGDSGTVTSAMIASAVWTAPAAIGGGTPAAGNFTTLGSSGLLSAALGITVTGGDTNIEASDNHNTNINTGTSTGTFTAGQNSATPGSIVLKGPVSFQAGTAYSAASWGTTSPVWNGAAMTLNDTTASGTVTNDVAYSLQAPNFTSTGGASTTITSAIALDVLAPTCSGGVVCTNLFAIATAGKVNFTGGANISSTTNINASANATTNIGTGTTTSAVTIGGGSDGVIINSNQSGSIKDTGLISTGTKFTTSGCSVSSTTGGATAGVFTLGANSCTVIITMNGATGLTAPTGWSCQAHDKTTAADLIAGESSSTTTTASIAIPVTAGSTDVISFSCTGY